MTGTVHVCWSPLSPDAYDVDWLDTTEQGRFDRLQRLEDRRRFVTSRVLLKTVVGRLAEVPPTLVRLSYDCTRCGRPHGRPMVTEPAPAVRWHVSLSHADQHVMVAVTDIGPVGVDVETVAATGFAGFDDVALTSMERLEVERYDPKSRPWARAVYWTRKEAVLKSTGHGLAVDPATLEVSAPNRPAALMAWRAEEPLVAPAQIADVPMGDNYVHRDHIDHDQVDDDHVGHDHVDDDQVAAVAVLAHSPFDLVLHGPPGSDRGQVW